MTQRNAPANYPKRISNRMAMVEDPAHYRRTSYHANALGQADARLTPHRLYLLPGRADNVQQAAYRSLFRAGNLYFPSERSKQFRSSIPGDVPAALVLLTALLSNRQAQVPRLCQNRALLL